MSNWIRAVLNQVKIIHIGDQFEIRGVRTTPFFKEISRIFGTSRFKSGMFTGITSTSFKISRFFLYDFFDVIKMMQENTTRYYRADVINKLYQELVKIPEIARTFKNYPSRLNEKELSRFKFKPLPKQVEFFTDYSNNTQRYDLDGYILASSPGTGKTMSSLMLMAMLEKDITIVFSPNNALNEVWKDTLENVQGADTYVYPAKLDRFDYTHYVFSHENTKFAVDAVKNILKVNQRADIGIILDECHRFTELAADQTNNVITICKMTKSEDILFMSGTPFKAMGRELLPFLMATDKHLTPTDIEGFKKISGVSTSIARSIVAARIGRSLYKVEKHEVFDNDTTEYTVKVIIPDSARYTLPVIKQKMAEFVKERNQHYVENGPRLVAEYHRIIRQYKQTLSPKSVKEFERYVYTAKLIRETKDLRSVKDEVVFSNRYEKNAILPSLNSKDKAIFKDVKSVYKYVALKIQGEALGKILGQERTACNLSIVEHIDNGRIYSEKGGYNGEDWTLEDIFASAKSKTVMFTDFIEVLKYTDEMLKKRGYHPEAVYGDTNKDLVNIIARAEKDPEVDPIVATYKSLSTAVPLIFASACVLLNVPYRDYIYQQTVARVDRLGQTKPVSVFMYQLDTGDVPNISTRSHEIMAWSKAMVDELLGIKTDDSSEEIENEFLSSFSKNPLENLKDNLAFRWGSR